MNHEKHNEIVSFIWSIADDVLRDVYVRGKYRDVILPMTVIRRLDVLLEPTKEKVLEMDQFLTKNKIGDRAEGLRKASGHTFYNTSKFTLKKVLDAPGTLRSNFETYLDGFSENVQDIISKFKFRNQLDTLEEADVLYLLIEKFTDPKIHLGPDPVKGADGTVIHEGLSNLGMGYVFEELVRKFNEANNEEAGEHFTPRDVIHLMTHLVFLPIRDRLGEATYLIYDPACGSGGMLTESERFLLDGERDDETDELITDPIAPDATLHLFGQEVNPETYAICKADMLIKQEDPERIVYGSTLSDDGFNGMTFDFMLSNPPYGKSWKKDKRDIEPEKDDIRDDRYEARVWNEVYDEPETVSLTTRSNDGQLLFMVNMLQKMKDPSEKKSLGSRIATVQNGSALFTGDAGQGMSNIRRWILENDWLEAIVALPTGMFYNTGIPTYVWILSNNKPEHREGKVQLINAEDQFAQLRRNLGEKRRELSRESVDAISKTFLDFEDGDRSKVFDRREFGYYNIVVERPERRLVQITKDRIERFVKDREDLKELIPYLKKWFGTEVYDDFNAFRRTFKQKLSEAGIKTYKKDRTAVYDHFSWIDPDGAPVRTSGTLTEDDPEKVEYEPDTDLRDRDERVPMTYLDGMSDEGAGARTIIQRYFEEEIQPYVDDAWIDGDDVRIGYEINFARYFYEYKRPPSRKEVAEKILDVERENRKQLQGILREFTSDEEEVAEVQ
jgi:type I restriction enzyme M protein